MLTRCPHCTTTFRVTPEQLKARQGRVRCGECQAVFNALDTLVEETPKAIPTGTFVPPMPLQEAPEIVSASDSGGTATADEAIDEPASVPTSEPTPAPEPASEPAPEPEQVPAPEPAPDIEPEPSPDEPPDLPPQAPETCPEPASELIAPTLPTQLSPANERWILADHSDQSQPSPPPQPGSAGESDALPAGPAAAATELEPRLHEEPRRSWPWTIGALLGLAILAGQFTLYLRTEIATLYPDAKPALIALCEVVGCDLPLPAKAELVGIENSDLHPDTAGGGRLGMSALLKNRAPFAQEYPHLELTLTDVADQALVRRVLAPADYLPPKTDRTAGIAAGGEVAVNLTVDATGVPAAGYRLYLFYP